MIPLQGDSSADSGRGEGAASGPGIAARLFLLPLAAILAFSAPGPASAYGKLGHQVVGGLAEGMLTPKAKARVRALLGTAADGSPATLASASTWADEIRMLRPETRPWHYVTIQISQAGYDPARADSADLVKALKRQWAVLGNPGADRYAREEALKWTIHLIGDLHQPLHVGEDRDKGGNLAKVRVNRRTHNLHAVWDNVLLERLNLPADSLRKRLEREIAADPGFARRNSGGTVESWVDEVHARTARCYILRGKPMPKGIKVQLDRAYVRESTLEILDLLKIGGARLAYALNAALDPEAGRGAAPRTPAVSPAPPRGDRESWFADADEILEEARDGSGKPGSGAGSGAFAWSVNSKVYHAAACPDVSGIKPANLRRGDAPPRGLKAHAGCRALRTRPPSRPVSGKERVN